MTAICAPIGGTSLSIEVGQDVGRYTAGGWREYEMGATGSEWSLLRELRACIEGDKEPDYSAEHDLAVQKVLFEACGVVDGNALVS